MILGWFRLWSVNTPLSLPNHYSLPRLLSPASTGSTCIDHVDCCVFMIAVLCRLRRVFIPQTPRSRPSFSLCFILTISVSRQHAGITRVLWQISAVRRIYHPEPHMRKVSPTCCLSSVVRKSYFPPLSNPVCPVYEV